MLPDPMTCSIDELEAALATASFDDKLAWQRATMNKAAMARLYELAEGRDVGPEFFVGPDGAPLVWEGKNSMGLFNLFKKSFASHRDRIQGWNVNDGIAAWFGGPGHFRVIPDGAQHGDQLVFDYCWEVDSVPEGFPPVASNLKFPYKLVYGNMRDVVRKISDDFIVSAAYRNGKPEGVYFSLLKTA